MDYHQEIRMQALVMAREDFEDIPAPASLILERAKMYAAFVEEGLLETEPVEKEQDGER